MIISNLTTFDLNFGFSKINVTLRFLNAYKSVVKKACLHRMHHFFWKRKNTKSFLKLKWTYTDTENHSDKDTYKNTQLDRQTDSHTDQYTQTQIELESIE